MTNQRVYVGIYGPTKSPHLLLHYVPDQLILKDNVYQTTLNGIIAISIKEKKGDRLNYPLTIRYYQLNTFKHGKEVVEQLAIFHFDEM